MLSGIEISFATALIILLLIPSGPVALFGFNNPIRVSISLLGQTILDNLFWHLYSNTGRAALPILTCFIIFLFQPDLFLDTFLIIELYDGLSSSLSITF